VVSKITGIPVGEVDRDERKLLGALKSTIASRVLGQDDAVAAVAKAVKRNRAGFGSAKRPVGSFLFLGPSGVGKTEVARQLAATMYHGKMIRIDMSEYSEKHTISKLIGSPPGYVGYGEGGHLINSLRKDPHSLVLLDEIEKAHPNVWNVFLQAFEEGCITDGRGQAADCSHAIFIMTSNAGSYDMQHNETVGFRKPDPIAFREGMIATAHKALKDIFPPEFLGRLDGTIVFQPLAEDLFPQIAGIMMRKFEEEIASVPLKITWTRNVENELAKRGFSPTDGARPIRKVIREEIESPLVDMTLSDKPARVIIDFKNGEFLFRAVKDRKKAATSPVLEIPTCVPAING